MISVKCDMCGKDVTNDGRTTLFCFPHEQSFSSYDVCKECSNKIEEFIKSSDKRKEKSSETAAFSTMVYPAGFSKED